MSFLAFILACSQLACGNTSPQIFNVREFGAVGDGVTKDTQAVRRATQRLQAAGGGTLLFPSPGSYYTGCFNITSNTDLLVERGAAILGSRDAEDWPLLVAADVWPQFGHGSDCEVGSEACRLMHQSLIFGWSAENVTLRGGGRIDGNAAKDTWWRCAGDLTLSPCNGYSRPHLIMISNATNVRVLDLTVTNSPDWTLHFSSVSRLHVRGVTVLNPAAPNADGIDLDAVQDAVVEDCHISVGDDALCVKSGIDQSGRRYARPARDIVFRRNVIGRGHGITIGSEMSGGVYNVTFEDINMTGTNTGPRIKSQRGRGGVIDSIIFRRIVATNVKEMISFTWNYHAGLAPTNATATPTLQNVLLENCYFHGGGSIGTFDGLPESPILNVTLRDVHFNEGNASVSKCDFVRSGVCEGSTEPCPPCFRRRAAWLV